MAKYVAENESYESAYRSAQQRCMQDAIMMKQPPSDKGSETENILCDTGGRKTASVLSFQDKLKTRSDAFLICKIS